MFGIHVLGFPPLEKKERAESRREAESVYIPPPDITGSSGGQWNFSNKTCAVMVWKVKESYAEILDYNNL